MLYGRGEMTSNPESTLLDTIASLGYNWLEAADYNDGLFMVSSLPNSGV
ncbi:MAG: hypothetical protein R2744_11115 [Bacteroidales bacterium]